MERDEISRWAEFFPKIKKVEMSFEIINAFYELKKYYRDDTRIYHNFSHIEDCLDHFDEVKDKAENPLALEFAIWYHDIIYNIKSNMNEASSAEIAFNSAIKHGQSEEFANYVKELILVTEFDEVPKTNDGKIMNDVDLSILGAPKVKFDEYEWRIGQECARQIENLSYEMYRAGRTRVLQSFLNRDQIYLTEHFRERYEIAAKSNLKRALEKLR